MNSVPGRYLLLLATSLLAGRLAAQPLCDVLLRPAFHYTTDGLAFTASDSSRTYGPPSAAAWHFGDGTALSGEGYHQFSQPGTYPVCLTLSTVEGAHCSSTYCRDVVVPLDTCADMEQAWFTHHGSGTNANQFVDPAAGSGTGSWLWEFGDGTTSADPEPGHAWALPGLHFVSLTRNMDGCTSTYGRWVEVDGNATTCGPGLFADFTPDHHEQFVAFVPSLVSSGVTSVLGIWSYGDGVVDTAMVGDHTYDEPGTYQVCFLVGALAQAAMDTCFALVCHTINTYGAAAGIDDPSAPAPALWPNPAHGSLWLRWPGRPAQATIRVCDMLGRPVRQWVQVLQPVTDMHLHGLSEGRYTVEITAAQERHVLRLHIAY